LTVNDLHEPGPRKYLRANNLQHNAKKLHFFLYRVSTLWHIILMIKTVLLKNGKRVNLRKHQLEAIASINQEFYYAGKDRATIVHCCRSGKSLTAVSLHKDMGSKATVVFLPSLSLLQQTYQDWKKNCPNARILLVGSDSDAPDVERTTKTKKIKDFLMNSNGRESIIFSTYQSCKKICRATSDIFEFDLMICDEAHQAAGINLSKGEIHSDSCINATKRLYMTATPKMLSEAVKQRVLSDAKQYCMSDESVFGRQVHLYSFKEGIERGMLSDYEIVALGCLDKHKANSIKDEQNPQFKEIQETAKLHALTKALKTRKVTHCVSFHSNVTKALFFTNNFKLKGWKVFHINGELKMEEREKVLKDFAKSKKALLTNCKCLQEGINIVECDSVFFSDCKRGAIDVIQASSRPLTKDPKKPKGFKNAIFIPTLHKVDDTTARVCATSAFKTLIQLIKHMRSQDERIETFLHHVSSRIGANEPLDPDPIVKVEGFENLVHDIYLEIIPTDLRDSMAGRMARTRKANWTAEDIDRALTKANGSRIESMKALRVSDSYLRAKFRQYPWLYEKWGKPMRLVTLEEAEEAMELNDGNMKKAANYLGVSRDVFKSLKEKHPKFAEKYAKDYFDDDEISFALHKCISKGLSVADAKKKTAKQLNMKVTSLTDRIRKAVRAKDTRFQKFVRAKSPSEDEVMALFTKHGSASAIEKATGIPQSTIYKWRIKYPKVKKAFPSLNNAFKE